MPIFTHRQQAPSSATPLNQSSILTTNKLETNNMENPSSPPISPLTYNTSSEWSYDAISGDDPNHEPITGNNEGADQIVSELSSELVVVKENYEIGELEPTPRAGVGRGRRKKKNCNRENCHWKAEVKQERNITKAVGHRADIGEMSASSSVDGVLAGRCNGADMDAKQNKFADSSCSATGSISSKAWRRLRKSKEGGGGGGRYTDHRRGEGTVKKNETEETMENEEESLRELEENEVFALEVGLMFSQDDGDTIANADLYSQGISNILTMDSIETGSFGYGNNNAAPSSDLSAYLNQHRHMTCLPNNLTDEGDDSVGNGGYIQNPKYVIEHQQRMENNKQQQQQQQFFNDDASRDTNTTARDEHGNRLPPNAKNILGFKKKQRNNTANPNDINLTASQAQHAQAIQALPVPKPSFEDPKSNQQMEKRLRDIAGTLNHDWRSGPTTFIASPALARRLRDFQFAREKRRKKYGIAKPWGILGLYDHLSGVRIDVEWAEDAAWRRMNGNPYLTWSDFESLKNSGKNRPFVTYFIVSMCTAMMFASYMVNGWTFEPISVNPMIGPSAETLLRLGAKESYLIVVENEIWRLVSPMVLHAGLIHYVLNMLALWYVGKAIELIHGHLQAVLLFVVPAIGGTILSAIVLPQYITVGASGGILGFIGACISDIVMNWNLLFNEFVNERGARMSHARVLLVLFIDIVVNCVLGITPFVDNFTHLGGMIYGFLCGLSTIQMVSLRFFGHEKRCGHKVKLFLFRFFGLLVSIAGIIASSIVLFSGDGVTNPCPSCEYFSCVAFPPWTAANNKWWYCDDCAMASAEGTMNTATGEFIEMDLTCPDETVVNIKVDEMWPQDELGLEEMLPMLCRERCF